MNAVMIITVGIFLLIGAQIGAFLTALVESDGKGAIKCLFIPLYPFVYVKKQPKAKVFMWASCLSVVLIVVGTVLSSM